MKKITLLTPILSLSALAGVTIPLASCSNQHKDPVETKFICEQPRQTTERGQTACWYLFNFEGENDIPDDLTIKFDRHYPQLNAQILYNVVEGSENRQLRVGIEGIKKFLEQIPTTSFKLVFSSKNLAFNQEIKCGYTYLPSKIHSTGSRRVEFDVGTTTYSQNFDFQLDDASEIDKTINVKTIIIDRSSDDITIPTIELKVIDIYGNIKVNTQFYKSTGFEANDWMNFDLQFEDEEKTWVQVIKNFHFEIKPVEYDKHVFNTQTEVVIDAKGNKQKALKVEKDGKGILPQGTPVGSAFEITFNLTDWPKDWYQENTQWKFGSYKHPKTSHVEYYHYSSISVWADIGGAELVQLKQTEPGDYEGESGLWWVSDGGPITILYNKIKDKYSNLKSFTFRLRTADEIESDSSFYITYA